MHEHERDEHERVGRARADQAGPGAEQLRGLWAPWRSAYLAGEDGIDGCAFCVIPARDPGEDRRSLVLHRGEHAFVVLNAYPYNPGHLMAIPYHHTGDLTELDEPTAQEVWALARRGVAALRTELGASGVNLGMNLGRAGGAGIAEHVHLHAVPRWGGDTNFISVVGATRVLPESLVAMHDRLAPAFA